LTAAVPWNKRHFRRAKEKILPDEEMAQAWAKHYPNHRAEKVSEHVCRLICLCIDYRVIGEIAGGDTTTGLECVLASMRIQKKEFDDVTNTYESLIVPQPHRPAHYRQSIAKSY
jgi:hypothetical protein